MAQTASLVTGIFKKFDQTGDGTIAEKDLMTVLSAVGITKSDMDAILKEFSQGGSGGKVVYSEFLNNLFGVPTEQVSVYVAVAGDSVRVPVAAQDAVIIKRTTTDVQLRLQDGNEVWYEIEEVDGGPCVVHEINTGGKASMIGGDRCEVVDRTTGELKLRLPDGTEVWTAVEDLEPEGDQSPHKLASGANARVAPSFAKANIVQRTTADLVVVLENGTQQIVAIEDLAQTGTAPSAEAIAKLRSIFDLCDTSKDEKINKRELIKICRADKSVADFFGLQPNIRQEDGSRDKMERLFQDIDTDGDRQMSWPEFRAFYLNCKEVESAMGNSAALAIENKPMAIEG